MGATVCPLLRDSAGIGAPSVAMGMYRSVGESTLLEARLLSLKVPNSSAARANSSETPNTGGGERNEGIVSVG